MVCGGAPGRTNPKIRLVGSGNDHATMAPRQTTWTFGASWDAAPGNGIWGAAMYYLPTFCPVSQNSNWHNPQVLEARARSGPASGWNKGVDGFPHDAVNFFVETLLFAINPERTPEMGLPDGISPDTMVRQQFVNSFCRPEVFERLPAIRALVG